MLRAFLPTRASHVSALAGAARYFLDRLPSMNFCEGLNDLSVRWVQPIQQQGRRVPCLSCAHTRSTWSRRVSGFLTEIAQQIHSLRASGVRSSHAARALGSDVRTFRKSGSGSSCATPPEIALIIRLLAPLRAYCIGVAQRHNSLAGEVRNGSITPRPGRVRSCNDMRV